MDRFWLSSGSVCSLDRPCNTRQGFPHNVLSYVLQVCAAQQTEASSDPGQHRRGQEFAGCWPMIRSLRHDRDSLPGKPQPLDRWSTEVRDACSTVACRNPEEAIVAVLTGFVAALLA